MLTDRERWLMTEAFGAGATRGGEIARNERFSDAMAQWLDDSAADGVTVEMVLAKSAPPADTTGEAP